jgi:hypothetical protein
MREGKDTSYHLKKDLILDIRKSDTSSAPYGLREEI